MVIPAVVCVEVRDYWFSLMHFLRGRMLIRGVRRGAGVGTTLDTPLTE